MEINDPTKRINGRKSTTIKLAGRNMHTGGNMYRLKFSKDWYILGESEGKVGGKGNKEEDDNTAPVPVFKLVAYRGNTLQVNYDGAFIYAHTPNFPESSKLDVHQMEKMVGINLEKFTQIDNTCPVTKGALSNHDAGKGLSTTDWVNLVVGEGVVINWVVPGRRGEYNKK